MNDEYKILLEKYNKLESQVRNQGGPPQTLGLRTKNRGVFTMRSRHDIEFYCDSHNEIDAVRDHMLGYLETTYEQFSFDRQSGDILAAIDKRSDLIVSTNIYNICKH